MSQLRLSRRECKNDDLPDVCMTCGADATHTLVKTFSWYPPWAFLLGGALLALIIQKKMTVGVPRCDQCRDKARTRTRIVAAAFGLSFLLFLGGIVLVLTLDKNGNFSGLLVAAGGLGVLGSLVLLLVFQSQGPRPTEITADSMTLTGVDDEFIDAMRALRKKRRRDDEDDEDE